jgi:hypothetical protein
MDTEKTTAPPPELPHFKIDFPCDPPSGLGGLSANDNNHTPKRYNNSTQCNTQQQREHGVRSWCNTYPTVCHTLELKLNPRNKKVN